MSREPRTERHFALNNHLPENAGGWLLGGGAVEGPGKRTRPITHNRLQRLLRWLRATFWRNT